MNLARAHHARILVFHLQLFRDQNTSLAKVTGYLKYVPNMLAGKL